MLTSTSVGNGTDGDHSSTRQTHDVVLLAEAAESTDAPFSGSTDIHEDDASLYHLKHGRHLEGISAAERDRAARRSKAYRWAGEHLWRVMADGTRRLCPPPSVREGLIARAHGDAGHYGARRTASNLAQTYWWSGLLTDVGAVTRACEVCQRRNATFTTEPPVLNTLPIRGLFYRFGVDLAGPLPTTERGGRYVMIAIDHFSKHLTTAALPNKESQTVASAFLERVLSVYGAPAEVVTDQGTEFRDAFDRQLQDQFIDHRTTSAYHPQANGLTERAVQTVKRALGKLACQRPDRWDEQLPHVTLGYNASVQESTGFAPYFLLYAVPAVVPPAVRERFSQPLDFSDPHLAAASLFDRALALSDAMLVAGGNLLIAQHRDERHYLKTRAGAYVDKAKAMQVGSYVLTKVQDPTGLQLRAQPEILRVVEVRGSGVLRLVGRCGTQVSVPLAHCHPYHGLVEDGAVHPQLARPSKHLACEVCELPSGESSMLLCDGCGTGWHMACLTPPLAAVPPGTWVCPVCVLSGLTPEAVALAPQLKAPALERKPRGAHMAYEGARMAKPFIVAGVPTRFEGVATYVGHQGPVALFRIDYSDGDSEQLPLSQLKPLCLSRNEPAVAPLPEPSAPCGRRRASNVRSNPLSGPVAAVAQAAVVAGALPAQSGWSVQDWRCARQ